MVRFLLLAPILCALVSIQGCGSPSPPGFDEFAGDPKGTTAMVDLIQRARSAEVVREISSVRIGEPEGSRSLVSGWDTPEFDEGAGQRVWATTETAVVDFVLLEPSSRTLEFSCRGYSWPGGPEQIMTVVVNGREIERVALAPTYSNHAVRIPAGALGIGSNRIELGFAWTARPVDHEPESSDTRTLAASFRRLALTSGSDDQNRPSSPDAPVIAEDRVVLRSGTGLRFVIPVPEGAFLELEAETAGNGEPGPPLLLWLAERGGPTAASTEIDPSATADGPVRLALDPWAGDLVEIGIAAAGGHDSTGAVAVSTATVAGREGSGGRFTNLLLIEIDTLRADHLGSYGGDVHTPSIDAIAADGVLFSNARAHVPITGPSHASLFTSLLPMEHGVLNNAQELRSDLPTMAEALWESGRQTSAVISLGVLQREFGFSQGFDRYGDAFPRDWLKDASEVTDEVLSMVDAGFWEPYFLFVHYSDPHEPYAPSDAFYPRFDLRLDGESIGVIDAGGRGHRFVLRVPAGDSVLEFVPLDDREPGRLYRVDNLLFDDREIAVEAISGWNVIPRRMSRTTYESSMPASVRLTNPRSSAVETGLLVSCKKLLSKPEIRAAYAEEVEFADRQIGRLMAGLDERGLLRDTLVIFFSDHGEGLGNHNHVGHISQLYDSLIHVPLIFSWPERLPEGVVIDASVSLVDVFPTVAELLELDPPERGSGASLVPLIRGERPPDRPVIAATYRPESYSDKRAIVMDGFKYIHSWRDDQEKEELYDVANDPGELVDLASDRPEVLERLRAELGRRLAEMSASAPVNVELSEEDKAQLEALGYLR